MILPKSHSRPIHATATAKARILALRPRSRTPLSIGAPRCGSPPLWEPPLWEPPLWERPPGRDRPHQQSFAPNGTAASGTHSATRPSAS